MIEQSRDGSGVLSCTKVEEHDGKARKAIVLATASCYGLGCTTFQAITKYNIDYGEKNDLLSDTQTYNY